MITFPNERNINMSDTVFRSRQVAPKPTSTGIKAPVNKLVPRGVDVDVNPPFTEYEKMEGKPYLVEHYELGTMWNRGDMYSDAFNSEVLAINTYLEHMISKGEVNNTIESVKNELKRIEKMINVKKDARKSMRIGLVAEYANFLLKSENIKKESAKHGLI